jgi:Uncharacterized conserved protein
MAKFEVVTQEGLKMIRCVIENEMVRAESGALHYMRGHIELASSAPSVGGFLKSVMTRENIFRPTYQGSGEIFFGPPIFGEYEIIELSQEEWILEQGSYVCSDAAIEVGIWRNKALTALFGGEGWFQTSVKGTGQVVIQAPGKLQRIDLKGEKLSVDGKFAIARTANVSFDVQKAANSILGSLTSGEGLLSTFSGNGTVLIAPIPNLYDNLLATIKNAIPRGK